VDTVRGVGGGGGGGIHHRAPGSPRGNGNLRDGGRTHAQRAISINIENRGLEPYAKYYRGRLPTPSRTAGTRTPSRRKSKGGLVLSRPSGLGHAGGGTWSWYTRQQQSK